MTFEIVPRIREREATEGFVDLLKESQRRHEKGNLQLAIIVILIQRLSYDRVSPRRLLNIPFLDAVAAMYSWLTYVLLHVS